MAKNGRGRPALPVKLPRTAQFTINDLKKANPQITCRITLYTKRDELIAEKRIKLLKTKLPTGGVGKPMDVYQNVTVARAARKCKATKAALAGATVDLATPAPAPQPVAS